MKFADVTKVSLPLRRSLVQALKNAAPAKDNAGTTTDSNTHGPPTHSSTTPSPPPPAHHRHARGPRHVPAWQSLILARPGELDMADVLIHAYATRGRQGHGLGRGRFY